MLGVFYNADDVIVILNRHSLS